MLLRQDALGLTEEVLDVGVVVVDLTVRFLARVIVWYPGLLAVMVEIDVLVIVTFWLVSATMCCLPLAVDLTKNYVSLGLSVCRQYCSSCWDCQRYRWDGSPSLNISKILNLNGRVYSRFLWSSCNWCALVVVFVKVFTGAVDMVVLGGIGNFDEQKDCAGPYALSSDAIIQPMPPQVFWAAANRAMFMNEKIEERILK